MSDAREVAACMKTSLLPQKAERFCVCVLSLLCLLVFAFLFYRSFTSSWLNRELGNEYVYWERDSLLSNFIFLAIAVAGSALAVRLFQKRFARLNRNRLAVALSVLSVCIGIYWVQASATAPQADQQFITEQAALFNSGDFSGLQQGGYVGIYRQQLGIISILRVFDWLAPFFHTESWHIFQLFSALSTGLLVYSGFRVVARITNKQCEAELLYLLLAFVCAPMYIYDAFVYGESSSTAFVMLAAWMLLECLHNPAPRYLIGLYLSIVMALLLRTNTAIVMIGFAIVMTVKLLRAPGRGRLCAAVVLLLAVLTPTVLTNALYGDKIPENSKPMPPMLFVAMGTNDDAINAGWYNGYNTRKYEYYGFDPQAATETGKKDFAAFVEKCRANPGYAVDFYNRKISSQWNAPMYQCIVMNNHIVGTQTKLVQSLYEGAGNRYLTGYMNIYQMLIYGSVLVFVILGWKRRFPLENYLLLIAIFGGFLFSVLWEAKARYVYPYFLMMIPYAAVSLAAVTSAFWQYFDKKVARGHRPQEQSAQ